MWGFVSFVDIPSWERSHIPLPAGTFESMIFRLSQGRGCVSSLEGIVSTHACLGGGFKYFFMFIPIWGFMIQFDLRIFFRWVGKNHQLDVFPR